MKKKIVIPIIIGVIVIAFGIVGALIATGKISFGASAKDRVYVTKVSKVEQEYSFGGNTYMGIVETQDTLSVAKASDREIAKTFVKVGDHVNAGDELFEYAISDLNETITQLGYDIQNANMDLKDLEESLKKAIEDKSLIGTDKDPQIDSFGPYGYENLQSRLDEADNQIEAIKISIKQKQNSIASLNSQVSQAKSKIENSKVTAGMTGIIKTVNDGTSDNANTNAYIVIMSDGSYRIKGKINEQNVYSISVDMPVTVRSRVDKDKVWAGKITRIDNKPEEGNTGGGFYGDGGDSSGKSSKYPFYVELDNNNTELLLGQHVYIELGTSAQNVKKEGVWLPSYYIEYDEKSGEPFVWAADHSMKLKRRYITLGEMDMDTFKYEVVEGLKNDDYVCFPTTFLYEGVKCVTSESEVDYSSPMYNQNMDGVPEDGMMDVS